MKVPLSIPGGPQEAWNPFERPPTANDISEDLPAFFGVVFDSAGWCFARNKARRGGSGLATAPSPGSLGCA